MHKHAQAHTATPLQLTLPVSTGSNKQGEGMGGTRRGTVTGPGLASSRPPHTLTHRHSQEWYASRPPTPTLTPSASSCPNVVLPMPNSKGAEPQELEVPSVSAMCPAAKLVQDQALLATQPPGQPPDSHDSDTARGCLRCAPRPRPRASTTPVRLRRHLVSHTLVSYRVPTIWQPVHTEGEQQMVQHPSARASPPLPPPPPPGPPPRAWFGGVVFFL
jgi:hypothetical protein